jgi:hypothetical protein
MLLVSQNSIPLNCISSTCDTNTWMGAGGNRLSGDRQRNWEPLFSMRQVRGIKKRKEIQTGEWRRLLKSPIQPAGLDLDGTGLDESKCWIRRVDTLMLTLTVYTLLVLQTKRYLFGSTGERWIVKQFVLIMAAFWILTLYKIASYFGHFRETTYKTSSKNPRRWQWVEQQQQQQQQQPL